MVPYPTGAGDEITFLFHFLPAPRKKGKLELAKKGTLAIERNGR